MLYVSSNHPADPSGVYKKMARRGKRGKGDEENSSWASRDNQYGVSFDDDPEDDEDLFHGIDEYDELALQNWLTRKKNMI